VFAARFNLSLCEGMLPIFSRKITMVSKHLNAAHGNYRLLVLSLVDIASPLANRRHTGLTLGRSQQALRSPPNRRMSDARVDPLCGFFEASQFVLGFSRPTTELRMITPDTWTDAEYDAAMNRLCSRSADQFARDLDVLGCKIVPQRGWEPGDPQHGWPMNGSKSCCPLWAEDPFNKPPVRKPPKLRLIDGGKPRDDPI
jgi:hypothetical protein